VSLLRSDSKVAPVCKALVDISRHKRSNKLIHSSSVINVRGGGRGGAAASGDGAAASGGGGAAASGGDDGGDDDGGGDDGDDDSLSYASLIAWNFAVAVGSSGFLSGW